RVDEAEALDVVVAHDGAGHGLERSRIDTRAAALGARGALRRVAVDLGDAHIHRGRAALALPDGVLDTVTLTRDIEPDGRPVHKKIFAARIRGDEAEPLLGVVPLDCSAWHKTWSSCLVSCDTGSLPVPCLVFLPASPWPR